MSKCETNINNKSHTTMQIGDKAPEVLGHDENGNEIRLSDFKGKKLVLYFYPKDMTSGCTTEACNLRDNMGALEASGYAVLGASVDDAKSHQKFIEVFGLHQRPVYVVAQFLSRRFLRTILILDLTDLLGITLLCLKSVFCFSRTASTISIHPPLFPRP